MKTIEEVERGCREAGERIEMFVADGGELEEFFTDGNQTFWFKVLKDGERERVVGGEILGDDTGRIISERDVTAGYANRVVGYVFNEETKSAMLEFFSRMYVP